LFKLLFVYPAPIKVKNMGSDYFAGLTISGGVEYLRLSTAFRQFHESGCCIVAGGGGSIASNVKRLCRSWKQIPRLWREVEKEYLYSPNSGRRINENTA
jgi:hypothetical protein